MYRNEFNFQVAKSIASNQDTITVFKTPEEFIMADISDRMGNLIDRMRVRFVPKVRQ